MARYTGVFTVAASTDQIQQTLYELLQACDFDIIYQNEDYLMGREVPGNVPFAKLATVETLIDRTLVSDKEVRLRVVVKNSELPLQLDNHCRQMFDVVNTALSNNRQLRLLESTIS